MRITCKEVDVTHSKWVFSICGWHGGLVFACLDKIIKYPCFVSFYHGLRITLSEVSVQQDCLYPSGE